MKDLKYRQDELANSKNNEFVFAKRDDVQLIAYNNYCDTRWLWNGHQYILNWGVAKRKRHSLNIKNYIGDKSYYFKEVLHPHWFIKGGQFFDCEVKYIKSINIEIKDHSNFIHKFRLKDLRKGSKFSIESIKSIVQKTEYLKKVLHPEWFTECGIFFNCKILYKNSLEIKVIDKFGFKHKFRINDLRKYKNKPSILSLEDKSPSNLTEYFKQVDCPQLLIVDSCFHNCEVIYNGCMNIQIKDHRGFWHRFTKQHLESGSKFSTRSLKDKSESNLTEYFIKVEQHNIKFKCDFKRVVKYLPSKQGSNQTSLILECPFGYIHKPIRLSSLRKRTTPLNYTTLSDVYTPKEIKEYLKLNPYIPFNLDWLDQVRKYKYGVLYLLEVEGVWLNEDSACVIGLTHMKDSHADAIESVEHRYRNDFKDVGSYKILRTIRVRDKKGLQLIENHLKTKFITHGMIPFLRNDVKGLHTESCFITYKDSLIRFYDAIGNNYRLTPFRGVDETLLNQFNYVLDT